MSTLSKENPQHVLPDEDLFGTYMGRKTYLKDKGLVYYVDTEQVCDVQTQIFYMLAHHPDVFSRALARMPKHMEKYITRREFDPEQLMYHILTQVRLGKVPSPALR